MLRLIERDYETWERNVMAKSIAMNLLSPQTRGFPQPNTVEVSANEADIHEMRCAGDGSLWVQTSRALYSGGGDFFARWDVFSPEGEFVKQVEVIVDGRPLLDLLVFTDHGYVLIVRNFLDGALNSMGMRGIVNVDRDGEDLNLICYREKS